MLDRKLRELLPDERTRGLRPSVRLGRLLPRQVRERYVLKLAIGFLALVVLVAAAGGYTYTAVSNELHESVQEELTNSAKMQAEKVSTWTEQRRQSTRMLSSYDVVRDDSPSMITPVLQREKAVLPGDVMRIQVIDTEKWSVVASSSRDASEPVTFSRDATFIESSLAFTNNHDVAVTRVYELDGENVMAFVSPVPGSINRAVVVTAHTSDLASTLNAPVEGAFTQVVDANGVVQLDQHGERTARAYADQGSAALTAGLTGGEEEAGTSGAYETAANGVMDESHVVAYAPAGEMAVVVHAPTATAYHLQQTVARDIGLLVLLVILGVGLLGLFIHRGMASPLGKLADKLAALRNGDLDVDLDATREDELGTVERAVDDVRDDFRDQRADAREYGEVMKRSAAGDLTARMDEGTRSRDMRRIAEAFNEMMDELEHTVVTVKSFGRDVDDLSGQVAESAAEVTDASSEVAESITQIADGASEQSENVTAVTEEINNLSAAVEEIAATTDELENTATAAADTGEAGQAAASDALEKMDGIRTATTGTVEEVEALDERIQQVSEIVDVIDDIAEQTNLLALNANIEAARAGEAGDGFAVVSHEVKALAEETQESAESIEDLIDDIQRQRSAVVDRMEQMQSRVEDGTESVSDAIEAFDDVVGHVGDTNVSVKEISSATSSQADSAQDVLSTSEEVANIGEETSAEAENVSAAAEEQTAAINEVTANAQELATHASSLQSHLAAFDVADETDGGGFSDTDAGETPAAEASRTGPDAQSPTATDGGADDPFEYGP